MVMVNPTGQQEYYMDGYLQNAYDRARQVIKKDWDFVFLIDGPEGSGKSVLAQQGATYCDPTFNVDRMAFTPEEFKKIIVGAGQYNAVVYDEAYTGLSSRGAMTDINKVLVQMLAEIRQKNLFVFIVMPTFFDLDRYAAIWRSRALIHVYTASSFERGYLAFYNIDKKKDLYINGKKFYSYSRPRPDFTGRFTNVYTVDEAEYRKRKLKALGSHNDKGKAKDELRLSYALKALCNHISIRQAEKELRDLGLVISNDTIRNYIAKIHGNELSTND